MERPKTRRHSGYPLHIDGAEWRWYMRGRGNTATHAVKAPDGTVTRFTFNDLYDWYRSAHPEDDAWDVYYTTPAMVKKWIEEHMLGGAA